MTDGRTSSCACRKTARSITTLACSTACVGSAIHARSACPVGSRYGRSRPANMPTAQYKLNDVFTLRAGAAYHRFAQEGIDLFYDSNVNGTNAIPRGTSVGDISDAFSNRFGSWLVGNYAKGFASTETTIALNPSPTAQVARCKISRTSIRRPNAPFPSSCSSTGTVNVLFNDSVSGFASSTNSYVGCRNPLNGGEDGFFK